MKQRWLIPAVLGAALAAAPSPALGQQDPRQVAEHEKQLEFNRLFRLGLEAITARQLERSEQLFKACVQLYPNLPTAYYNLACTYSLAGKTADAVAMLRQAYDRGFNDLAHVSRDADLDNIRKEPAFRALLGELEAKAVAGVPEPLAHFPQGREEPFPLLVYVPDDQTDTEAAFERLKRALPASEWGLLVPRAPGAPGRPAAWDDRAEFLVTRAVRETLEAQPQVDRRRVYIMGDGRSGMRAVGMLAHHPELFGGVLAAGLWLGVGVEDLTLSNTRAFLVVHEANESEVRSGVTARDAFAEAGSQVVLLRHARADALLQDRDLLLRGLAWLMGRSVDLPGAGGAVPF